MSYPTISSTVVWQLAGGFHKSPAYNTIVQIPAAGRGISTAGLKPFPTWNFEVNLKAITGGEALLSSVLAQFLGLYMEVLGGAGFFLMTDINDNTVSVGNSAMMNVTPGAAVPMGLNGDGVSTQFQLVRQVGGGGWDVIQNVSSTPSIYVNGALVSAVS